MKKKLCLLLLIFLYSFCQSEKFLKGRDVTLINIAFEAYCKKSATPKQSMEFFQFEITADEDFYTVYFFDERYLLGGDCKVILSKNNLQIVDITLGE